MVDQQELEHAGARRGHLVGPRVDDHAFGADRRARRLQLRHLLDLHDADAAGAVDADAGVVAVVRDGDAALDGRLQDGLAFFDRDRPAVDRQRDGFHSRSIITQRETLVVGSAGSSVTIAVMTEITGPARMPDALGMTQIRLERR